MAAKKKNSKKENSTIARSDDGTIQITFTIPWGEIKKNREKTAEELGKEIAVPGFRKGKAPLKKLLEHIPANTLLEKTLAKILPNLLAKTIDKYKIKPVIYPKFEMVKAVDGEDWQIRATTAELTDIVLGDYKKDIKGSLSAKKIWTPGSGIAKDAKEPVKPPSREEKEQAALKALLGSVKVKIPQVLLDEEVNTRLSRLLERLEKMGLNLESYLASIGKTAEQLRAEYSLQAKDAIALDILLVKVADMENLKVTDAEIEAAIKSSSADQQLSEQLQNPEQKRLVESVLKKRKALEYITSLA
jgi:FKBP-type peptidyl-prolyl cis-trans isomerase (trigger factor)